MAQQESPVITVDCHYLCPEHAASYLLIEEGRAAFIDNNTVHAIPYLFQALAERGLRPHDVQYLIITHLHLDHAGATSALVRECPNATVLVHPGGVRHLVERDRLIAGVKAVYGESEYRRLYGEILPIDPSRIRTMEDEETLAFGRRTLRFLHTRGHSNHHFCIHDSLSNGVFTGDTFGVEYKPSRPTKRPYLLCSTAPPDFDPGAARASVARIVATGAERVYLAHFGELSPVRESSEIILASIGHMEAILEEAVTSGLAGEALQRLCEERIRGAIREHAHNCGTIFGPEDQHLLDTDTRIDAQGIAVCAERLRKQVRTM
ncbi:MAG: MBL fold metallo-hydrolase [Candidatus Hydrogenedentes bacterium]|nr:MBL fold metallo-hydrolase [Candidatus Hydrogenedentota bacterium]